jgi:outer membrane biosynthesis protein TonB
VDAVAQWRFDPAKKDDKPVAVKLTLEIEFHSM